MAAPKPPSEDKCKLYDRSTVLPAGLSHTWIWKGNVKVLLERLPERELVDLVVTSPPYNMGKVYENKRKHKEYIRWQGEVIDSCVARLKSSGSICWQVGNIVKGVGRKSEILPLDIGLHEHFVRNEMKLRNRIVWHYGHGFHCKHRFSGRYEVIMWYTKSDSYHFDLDPVRVAAKYPGKKHYRGPKAGEYSCNPLGKNPEDSWDFLE
ncbi:MAG: site-specific DNA-methyltransferase, partial [bacterium]